MSLLLLVMAQLFGCATSLLPSPAVAIAEPVRLPPVAGKVRDVAVVGDQHYVSLSSVGTGDSFAFVLSDWNKGSERRLLELAGEQYYRGERLIAANGSWWYSAERTDSHGSQIVFAVPGIKGKAASTTVSLPAGATPLHWMPLQAVRPSGLLLSRSADGSVAADLVTPEGPQRLGVINGFKGFAPQRGGAVMLPGNVVALVSADGTWPVPAALTLRLFCANKPVVETTLPPCNLGPLSEVAVAAGDDGSIGILVTSQDGAAAAAVVNTGAVVGTKWQTAATGKGRATLPRITATGNRFAAAWLQDGIVAMTALPPGQPATVTRDAEVDDPLLVARAGADGRLDLIWRERGGDLFLATPRFP